MKESITDLRKWNLIAGGSDPKNDVVPASVSYGLEEGLQFAVTEILRLEDRIKRLEEQLMEVKNKHAVLIADVVLDDERAERINHLETALRRIANQDYRGNRSTESQIAFEALEDSQ